MLMLMDPNQLPGQSIPPGQIPAPATPPASSPVAPQSNYAPQPLPNAPASGHFDPSKYEFITTPAAVPKKTLIPTTGSSKLQRIIFVVLGLFALITVLLVVFSLLGSSGKQNTAQLTTVGQQQTELIRVATLAEQKVASSPAKNLAANVKLSVTTQQSDYISALGRVSIKLDSKTLAQGANSKNDQELKTAESNGRYDEAFLKIMRTELDEYQKATQAAFNGTKSKSVKENLNTNYQQTTLLIESLD